MINFILSLSGLIFMIIIVNSRYIEEEMEKSLSMKTELKTATLRCRQGEIIHDVRVSSYTRARRGHRCYGLQPNVLISANDCFWSRRCRIVYSKRQPILITNVTSCIGRTPKKLNIRYSCIQRERVFFIHDPAEGDFTSKSKFSNYGLIVSHVQFPWQYKTGVEAILNLKPTNSHLVSLYVTVMSVDIALHDLAGYKTELTNWTPIEDQTDINVATNQTKYGLFTDRASPAASGFRLCFYWTSETLSNENICQKVNDITNKR